MMITAKQANVLQHLERVVFRTRRGKPVPFLDGEICKIQLNSLAVKKLIVLDRRGKPARIGNRGAAPEGSQG